MKNIFAVSFLCLLSALAAGTSRAAETKPVPMDAAAGQQWLPDTVLEDGMHMGSWSASGTKPAAAPRAAAPAAAAAQDPAPQADLKTASPSEEKIETGHTVVVTSIQTCYDQLDPADVAEIKANFPKPYAECQARLEAKLQGKREWVAGEASKTATPETPRNYIRVQQPEASPVPKAAVESPNIPGKSATKLNP